MTLAPRNRMPLWTSGLVAVAAACLAPPSWGQATLITSPAAIPNGQVLDIDTGSTGLPGTGLIPPIPNVTFVETAAVNANGPYDVDQFSSPLPGGGRNFLGHQYLGNIVGAAGYSSDEIDFATPVTAVGGYVQVGTGGAITLLAYDGNTLVGGPITENGLPGFSSNDPVFYGFSDPQGITRIVWEPGNGAQTPQGGFTGGFIGIGQITVGAVVPEPASLGLVGLGLAALAAHRLRRAFARPGLTTP